MTSPVSAVNGVIDRVLWAIPWTRKLRERTYFAELRGES